MRLPAVRMEEGLPHVGTEAAHGHDRSPPSVAHFPCFGSFLRSLSHQQWLPARARWCSCTLAQHDPRRSRDRRQLVPGPAAPLEPATSCSRSPSTLPQLDQWDEAFAGGASVYYRFDCRGYPFARAAAHAAAKGSRETRATLISWDVRRPRPAGQLRACSSRARKPARIRALSDIERTGLPFADGEEPSDFVHDGVHFATGRRRRTRSGSWTVGGTPAGNGLPGPELLPGGQLHASHRGSRDPYATRACV